MLFQRVKEAIKTDDSESVEEVLCAGLSPNLEFSHKTPFFGFLVSDANWTLLHEAAEYNALNSATVSPSLQLKSLCLNALRVCDLKVLIDHGANIEKPNERSNRPLHIAAQYNSLRVARVKRPEQCCSTVQCF